MDSQSDSFENRIIFHFILLKKPAKLFAARVNQLELLSDLLVAFASALNSKTMELDVKTNPLNLGAGELVLYTKPVDATAGVFAC